MASERLRYRAVDPGFAEVVPGVDAVNVASLRILEKLGFERTSVRDGSFGETYMLYVARACAHAAGPPRKEVR